MSVVYCRGCGDQLQDTAVSCPRCGAPQAEVSPVASPGTATEPASLWAYFRTCLTQKYARFSGRARRTEYLGFLLINTVLGFGLAIVDIVLGTWSEEASTGLVSGLYQLATVIPGTAVAVRRLHDLNLSGWTLLWPLVPLLGIVIQVLGMLAPLVSALSFLALGLMAAVRDGQRGANRYGPSPKYPDV